MPYGLPDKAFDNIIQILSEYKKIQQAILFGSRAIGNYKESSDIDIALCGDDLNLKDLRKIELKMDELLLPWHIDLLVWNQLNEPGLKDHIQRVGVSLLKE